MHYLGFDLETGGFDADQHTICEACFVIWDDKWNVLDELELLLKNDQGQVIGTDEAFKVTGIDPDMHLKNPKTLTYTEGRAKLLEMLNKHKIPKKRNSYRFLGQNIVYFDIPFMHRQGFLTEEQSKKAGIHYNALDTTGIVTWLKEIDILPSDVGSISSLISYFNLEKGTAHRAKDDVYMQQQIYVKLCNLLKRNTQTNLQQYNNSDLLKFIEL